MTRQLVLGALFAAMTAAVGPAQAQNIRGTVRLSLDGNFVEYGTYQVRVPALTAPGQAQTGTRKQKVTETSWGLLQPSFAVGIGYGVTEALLVGGRALLATAKTEAGAAVELESSSVAFAPYLQYWFNAGSTLRPFLGADAGFEARWSKGGTARQKSSGFFLGPTVGVHLFAASGFSVGAGASAYYESRSVELGGIHTQTGAFAAVGTVSFSGWLGAPSRPPLVKQQARAVPVSAPATAEPIRPVSAPATAEPTDWDVHAERGVLYLKAPITNAVELSVEGRPLSHPDRVKLTVVVAGPVGHLRHCHQLAVVVDDERWTTEAVPRGRRVSGRSTAEALEGQVPVGSLAALADATDESAIEACGTSWSVPDYMRLRLASLVTEFRKKAEGRSLGLRQRPGVDERRGVLSTTLPLSDAVVLTLEATPAMDSQHVQARLGGQAPHPVLGNCGQAIISADGKTFELEAVVPSPEPTERQPVTMLAGQFQLPAVLALAESRQVPSVTICGQRFAVSEEHRLRVFDFAELFVQRARAAGTWVPPGRVRPPS